MTAFALALAALFNDPNLSRPAVYASPGGATTDCRVIVRMPDVAAEVFSEVRGVVPDLEVDVRRIDVVPEDGGTFTFSGAAYRVTGAPVSPPNDPDRLITTSAVVAI